MYIKDTYYHTWARWGRGGGAHHAEGFVNPKVRALKKVTDFGYPRACRFRKHQILNRSPEVPLPTF
jgi:hypothetical protein